MIKYVYCVNKGKVKSLTLNKRYRVYKINQGNHVDSGIPYEGVWVSNDNKIVRYYSSKRFVSIEEYREIVIDSLIE